MAKPKHLALLKKGTEGWNKWKRAEPKARVDLRGADLREASLHGVDLGGANLIRANLIGANLSGANLREAVLSHANLRGADISQADLCGADLRKAVLFGANLGWANLSQADLSRADLRATTFCEATLQGATLHQATLAGTDLSALDLSALEGLAWTRHHGPSYVGIDALERTAVSLTQNPSRRGEVEAFLRAAGLPRRYMETFGYSIGKAIEFYSCFISYSAENRPFARRLYDGLQGRGIRCWLDEHQILPGDDIYEQIDRGIRLWDKVLLCCSDASLTSWWVEREIEKALKKEREILKQQGRRVLALIPLALDKSLFSWESGKASVILERHAADFTDHQTDSGKFDEQFERVVKALRADEGGRPKAPKPRL